MRLAGAAFSRKVSFLAIRNAPPALPSRADENRHPIWRLHLFVAERAGLVPTDTVGCDQI